MAVKYDSGNRAGNEADEVNRGDAAYNKKFNKLRQSLSDVESKGDQILREEGKSSKSGMHIDTHGDEVYDNPESDNIDLGEQEKSAGAGGSNDFFKPGSESGPKKNAVQKFFSKTGAKPTTGVAAVMTFLFVVLSSIGGGASIGAALEKGLTNENANDTRTNLVMYRAFGNMLGSTECKSGRLICKMKTAAKEQIQKFKDGKFTVKGVITDENGKSKGGGEKVINPDDLKDGERVSMTAINANDGTADIKSPAEFQNRLAAEPALRSKLTNAFNMRTGDFLHAKFDKLLGKFGINKAKATPDEKKVQETKESIKESTDKGSAETDPQKGDNIKKTAVKSFASSSVVSGTAGIVSDACLVYNITRIAVGSVKAKWVIDLVRFGWPFMRLVSKMLAGEAVTDADLTEIEAKFGQLTAYLSPDAAKELEDKITSDTLTAEDQTTLRDYGIPELRDKTTVAGVTLDEGVSKADQIKMIEEIKGKTATDSQGLRAALYGDNTGLDAITKAYSTAAIGSLALASSAINVIQSGLGGQRNVRLSCIAANTISINAAGAQIVVCIAAAETIVVALACFGKAVLGASKYIVAYYAAQKALEALIPALLASVSLSSNLKGPAAGDALAAMMGLLLTRKSQSSALKPALTLGAVNQFLTTTNETYNQYGDELAYYEAKSTPFDTSNKYSFMGQIVSSLNPITDPSGQKTGFSYISNFMAVVGNVFNPAASALHSSPVILTLNQANLGTQIPTSNSGQTSECPDEEKKSEGLLCSRLSGQTINITSPRVLQWAEEDATGSADHLSEVINYLQAPQSKDEDQGGTKDGTCSDLRNTGAGDFFAQNCSDSSDKASIDDEGKPIEGSEYEKYVNYCTGDRALEMGSTDVDADTGSQKDQDWHSGLQCAKQEKGSPAGQGSYMMDAFAYYYNMCYTQYAVANGEADCTSGTAAATPAAGNSDVCSLLNNPHIHYEQKATEEDLKKLCAGQTVASYCSGKNIVINPVLITALTTNASKYDVTINNFGFADDRHVADDCQPGKQHWKGNAVDISKIQRIGDAQSVGTGSFGGIQYNSQTAPLIADYASDFLAAIPNNRGGIGQQGCGGGRDQNPVFNPRFPAGSVNLNGSHFFPDSCDHLHIDVRDRTNVNAL